jgi:hypothetical protein
MMISPPGPKATSLAQSFRRLPARKGKKRALVAVAHSIPVRVHHRLKTKWPRREPGADGRFGGWLMNRLRQCLSISLYYCLLFTTVPGGLA